MALRFGIVGCGMIANFHAAAIRDCPATELVGCTSRNSQTAKDFADKHHCQVYSSLDAMLDDPQIQAVSICSPSGAHLDPAVKAAAAGRHVVVEKPLEITTERCDRIIAACDAGGVQLGVTFQSRFYRSSELLKNAVDTGRFGTITLGDAYVKWFRSQEYYDSGAWRGTWDLDGGGALMNQAIHSVDLLLWIMGPVKTVSAMVETATHQRIEVEDVAVATLRFARGALGVIEATTTAFPGALKKIEISGSAGSVVLEEEDLIQWQFDHENPIDQEIRDSMRGQTKTGGGAADPSAIGHHGHQMFFEDFATAVQQNRAPSIDGQQGRMSVQLIEAIYRSAREGRPIDLI
jgi:predicted dehydrogenase